jgi:hypothetical protein
MNFELNVKEITFDGYLLTGKINNSNIIENLKNYIRNNKDEKLSYKTNVKAHFTGWHSLIENIDFINFLKSIEKYIKIIYPSNFIISSAWGNVLKKGDEVLPHRHSEMTAFCGILYLTDGGPGTFFNEYNTTIKEEAGKFLLFHPRLIHSVEKIKEDMERITVAFNMNEIKDWNNI